MPSWAMASTPQRPRENIMTAGKNAKRQDFHVVESAESLSRAAARVLFLVAGADKADVVRDIRSPIIARDPLPAELVAPDHGVVHWLFDKDAYSKMPSPK